MTSSVLPPSYYYYFVGVHFGFIGQWTVVRKKGNQNQSEEHVRLIIQNQTRNVLDLCFAT